MKYIKIIAFGYLVLFLTGFLLINVFEIDTETLETLDFANELVWYRVGFYSIVLSGWPWLSQWLVNLRVKLKLRAENIVFESEASESKYMNDVRGSADEEIAYFKGIWWKVAVFFAAFEIVAVQKFWL